MKWRFKQLQVNDTYEINNWKLTKNVFYLK